MSDLENELLDLAEDDHRGKKRASGSGSRKPKSQAYIDDFDDNDTEASMDLDSDDEDVSSGPKPTGNPYPLEGKYIDERDRERLERLPEIEREDILAARQEEIQQYKDKAQLDAMFKMTGADDEEEDDDDDDVPARKRRKHTSVTNEASRAMTELKNRRKAKDERAQRRAARRERRPRSTSPASQDDVSSEEGEISARDPWRQVSPSHFRASQDDRHGKEANLDSIPASCQELNSARLSRYELVDMMFKDKFEEVINGAYVRLMAGGEVDERGRQKYRVHRLHGFDKTKNHGQYMIEYKGKQVPDSRALLCQYGKQYRLYRLADVSNGDFDESEFTRWLSVLAEDRVSPPKRSELKAKHQDISALRERAMTEEEVSRQVAARKQANPAQRQATIFRISSLMSSKDLALRRNDVDAAKGFEAQIIELGGDPATGMLAGDKDTSAYDNRIQRINENNRRKTRETMAKAHEASLARKKAEDAVVKAKAWVSRASGIDDSAAKTDSVREDDSRPGTPPISGLRKGETPQQYVARTVELDLGDF